MLLHLGILLFFSAHGAQTQAEKGFLQTSAPPEHSDFSKWLLNSRSKPRSRCGDSSLWFLAWPLLLLLKAEWRAAQTGLGQNAASQWLLCAMLCLLVMAQQLSEGLIVVWWVERKHVSLEFGHIWIFWSKTGPTSQMLTAFSHVAQYCTTIILCFFMWFYIILQIFLWRYNSMMMLNKKSFLFLQLECHCHLQINSESSQSNVFSVVAIVQTLSVMEDSFIICICIVIGLKELN